MTIHLIGVIHTDLKSKPLVRTTINKVQPDIVFLEVGEYRLNMLQNNSRTEKLFISFRERIFKLRPRGRIIHSAVSINQMIRSIISEGVIVGNVDMLPAIKSAEKIGAEIIPIDMDQHTMMNKLGRSVFSIESLLNFNPRERIEFIRSIDFQHDITTLEGLSKIDHNMSRIIPQRYKVLVTQRNNIMTENIQQSINKNDTGVAIIGALHVPGMKENLEQLGYDVEVHL